MSQDARESKLREILWRCREEAKGWETNRTALTENGRKYLREDVALAAMRRVSTPLTPSDEMVEAGARAMTPNMGDTSEIAWQHYTARGEADEYRIQARACLIAALNLTGEKK
jgi:hypothetical protein